MLKKVDPNEDKEITKYSRIFVVVLVIIFGIFGFKSNIHEEEFITLNLTLKEKPDYYFGKRGDRSITLKFKEYKKDFMINSYFVYNAMNHAEFQSEVKLGDLIWVKIKKDQMDELDDESIINNYNKVYGIGKNNKSFLALETINKILNKSNRFLICLVLLVGPVFLFYAFYDKKTIISFNVAVALMGIAVYVYIFWLY